MTAVAEATGAKRDRVKTGLAVATSVTRAALTGQGALTLDQAAVPLEFEGDSELAVSLRG